MGGIFHDFAICLCVEDEKSSRRFFGKPFDSSRSPPHTWDLNSVESEPKKSWKLSGPSCGRPKIHSVLVRPGRSDIDREDEDDDEDGGGERRERAGSMPTASGMVC